MGYALHPEVGRSCHGGVLQVNAPLKLLYGYISTEMFDRIGSFERNMHAKHTIDKTKKLVMQCYCATQMKSYLAYAIEINNQQLLLKYITGQNILSIFICSTSFSEEGTQCNIHRVPRQSFIQPLYRHTFFLDSARLLLHVFRL